MEPPFVDKWMGAKKNHYELVLTALLFGKQQSQPKRECVVVGFWDEAIAYDCISRYWIETYQIAALNDVWRKTKMF